MGDWLSGAVGAARATDTNHELLTQYVGIPREDILSAHFSSRDFLRPAHYVCIDRRVNAIIIAVRGTMSASDTLTDLAATPAPLLDGYGHGGMVQAARLLALEYRGLIRETMQRCPELGRVITTGHSLGGGTATLLALLLHDGTS